MGSDGFSCNRCPQDIEKFLISANHSDDQRRGTAWQALLWPLGELGKVKKVGSLDLILARCLYLAHGLTADGGNGEADP